MPVVPGMRYVPLYEGRMVHQFDHAAKAYVGGEGRGAKWRDLSFTEKALTPHFYVDAQNTDLRACYCQVTGKPTNDHCSLLSYHRTFPAGTRFQ